LAKQFTLGKNERLKSRKLIEQLFTEGKNFSLPPYRIYYVLNNQVSPVQSTFFNIQFGVGVSGKNFKKAVDRNRIKRLTREAYRLQKNNLREVLKGNNQQLNLFLIYTTKELTDFNIIKEKLKLILNKLIKIIDENNTSNS
jgi:ribonuclease P protein component